MWISGGTECRRWESLSQHVPVVPFCMSALVGSLLSNRSASIQIQNQTVAVCGSFYSLQQRLSALSPARAAIHVQNNPVHHVIMSHIPAEWMNSRGCCSLSGLNLICMSLSCIDYTEYMSAPLGKVPAWKSALLAPQKRRNVFVSVASTSKPRGGGVGEFVVLLLWYVMQRCGHKGDWCSLLPLRGPRPT